MDVGRPEKASHDADAFVLDHYVYPRGRRHVDLYAIRQSSSGRVFDCNLEKLKARRGNINRRGPECLFIRQNFTNNRCRFESFSNPGKYLIVNKDNGRIQLGEAGSRAMFQLHDV
ncbi:uncharacterized protein [Diadema setosum]|uniref:uncharacterized protein n=1 Tax=Diadema setosum TaxID=31175 RepID=UPI003B3BAFC7